MRTRLAEALLGVRLAGRLLRRDRGIRVSWFAFGTALMLCGLLTVFGQLTLTSEQEQDRAFGPYAAEVRVTGDQADDWQSLASELGLDPADSTWSGNAPGIEIDEHFQRRDIYLFERNWSLEAYAEPVELLAGRWPTAAGEIAVTQGLDVTLGSTLAAYAGHYEFTVVGLASHEFPEQPFLLAGPGTLKTLRDALIGYRPGIGWFTSFSTLHLSDRLVQNIDGIRFRLEQLDGVDSAFGSMRADLVSSKSWVRRLSAGFLVPGAVLTVLSVVVAHALVRRRLQGTLEVVHSLGGSTRVRGWALGAAEAASLILGTVAGGVLGTATALLLRPVIAEVGEGYGPVRVPWEPVTLLIVVSVVASVAGALSSSRPVGVVPQPGPDLSTLARSRTSSRWRAADVRHVAAAVSASVALFYIFAAQSLNGIALVQLAATAAVVLMIPEAFDLVSSRVRGTRVVVRLIRRRAVTDRSYLVGLTCGLFVLLVLPLMFMVVNEMGIATKLEKGRTVRVVGDMLIQADQGPYPPHEGVVAAAAEIISDVRPIPAFNSVEDLIVISGEGEPLFFESSADLEQFLVIDLSEDDKLHLDGGGALTWGPSTTAINLATEADPSESIGSLAVHQVAVEPSEASIRFGSAALLSAATEIGLNVQLHAVLYRETSDDEIGQLREEMLKRGYPYDEIEVHEELDVVPPFAWKAALIALVTILFMTAWLFVRHAAKATSSIATTLLVLGADTRSAQRVGIGIFALCLLVVVPLATLVAIGPGNLASERIESFQWAFPWTKIGVVVLTFVVLVLTAAAINVSLHSKIRRT